MSDPFLKCAWANVIGKVYSGGRALRQVLAATACVGLLLATSGVEAGWVWERVGPLNAASGLSAVTGDAQDPLVVWVAGRGRVWVTDDGGDSFQLVLQTPGYRRSKRTRNQDSDEGNDDGRGPDQPEEEDPGLIQGGRGGVGGGGRLTRKKRRQVEIDARQRGGISRLRVIRDRVYACTARGLWSIARKARAIGTGRREFDGRRDVVVDVAPGPKQSIWVGSAKGLYASSRGALATPALGLGRATVTALFATQAGLIVATTRGLWRRRQGGFRRVGSELGTAVISDIVDRSTRLYLASARKIWVMGAQAATVREVIPLTNTRRVTVDRRGDLWAVGLTGAWRRHASRPFVKWRAGLTDPRLSDVFAPDRGKVRVWAVGRGGAWRLVTEAERLASRRARVFAWLGSGLPSVMETLERAQRAHHAHSDEVAALKRRRATAWLLPKVYLRYAPVRERITFSSLVPALERYIIDEVRVFPVDDEFRIFATWELYPVIFPMLQRGSANEGAALDQELKRIYRDQTRLRRIVLPLYQAWLRHKALSMATVPRNLSDAVNQLMKTKQLEADLAVYTDGWFPQSQPKKHKTPIKGASQ